MTEKAYIAYMTKTADINYGKATYLKQLEDEGRVSDLKYQRQADKYYRQTMDKITGTSAAKRMERAAKSWLLHPVEQSKYLYSQARGGGYQTPQQKAYSEYISNAYKKEVSSSLNPFVVMHRAKMLQLGGDRIRGQTEDYRPSSFLFGSYNPDTYNQDPVRSKITESPERKEVQKTTNAAVKQHVFDAIAKWGPLVGMLGLGGIGLILASRFGNKVNTSTPNTQAYIDWAAREKFGER